jgi:hypothetical protein
MVYVNAKDIPMDVYIAVLQTELDTLLGSYYNPNTEGTGHYNTAAHVLKTRINELQQVTYGVLES